MGQLDQEVNQNYLSTTVKMCEQHRHLKIELLDQILRAHFSSQINKNIYMAQCDRFATNFDILNAGHIFICHCL